MITCALSPAELVAEARLELNELRDHLDMPLRRLRREYLREPEQPLEHLMPWRSAAGNNWLIMLRFKNGELSVTTMVWYLDKDRRVQALWVAAQGVCYQLPAEVIEGYGDGPMGWEGPLDRLQTFFLENPFFAMQVEEPSGEDRWSVSVGLDHGLALGEWDVASDVVRVQAFVQHARLFGSAYDKQRRNAEHLFRMLTLHQRIELSDRARALVQLGDDRSKAA